MLSYSVKCILMQYANMKLKAKDFKCGYLKCTSPQHMIMVLQASAFPLLQMPSSFSPSALEAPHTLARQRAVPLTSPGPVSSPTRSCSPLWVLLPNTDRFLDSFRSDGHANEDCQIKKTQKCFYTYIYSLFQWTS